MGASTRHTSAAEEFVSRIMKSDDFEAFMYAHKDGLTPALADNIRSLAGEALKAGAFGYVSVAGNVAAAVNLRVGKTAEALDCLLLALQGEFQLAETVEAYEAVRSKLLQVEKRAGAAAGAESTRFQARGFAAQCGYFACRAAASPQPAEWLIQRSLEDVLALLGSQPTPLPPGRVQLLLNFVFPTLDLATARVWLDESGGIEAALRRIAAAVEEAIPAETQLSADPARDAAMAQVLARLPDKLDRMKEFRSARHGN